jgi:hypothetical protein
VDSPAYREGHQIYAPVTDVVSEAAVDAWLPGFLIKRAEYQRKVEERQMELEAAERELAIATRMLDFADRILKGTQDAAAHGMDGLPVEVWEKIFTEVDSDWRPLTLVSRRWRAMLVNGHLASHWNPVVFGEGNAERWELLKLTRVQTSRIAIVKFAVSSTSVATVNAIFRSNALQCLTIADWYGKEETAAAARAIVKKVVGRIWPRPKIEELVLEGYSWGKWGYRGGMDSAFPAWAADAPLDARTFAYAGIECPSKLVLDSMITPEKDLSLCFWRVEVYTEMRTIRIGGRLPKDYLEKFVNLRVLRLEGVLPPPNSFGQVVLPCLRELHVLLEWEMVEHGVVRGALFESLDCPSLVTMRLRAGRCFSEDSSAISNLLHADFTNFLMRSPAVQTLEIGLPVPFTVAALENHMRACPLLLELHVSFPHQELFSARFFNTLREGTKTVAPLLKTLKIMPKGGRDWRTADSVGFGAFEAACDARFGEALECLDLRPNGDRREGTTWIERWDDELMTGFSWVSSLLKTQVHALVEQNGWNIVV